MLELNSGADAFGEPGAVQGAPDRLDIERRTDEPIGRTLARSMLDPMVRHASLAGNFGEHVFGNERRSGIMETVTVLGQHLAMADKGDLTLASRILTSQAVSLDAIFTELARRSAMNMGQHLEARERYMRLALEAQSASRSTLKALARLHQTREQTVRHAHVNSGGQAVVADQFHHHAGGPENAESIEQSHATAISG